MIGVNKRAIETCSHDSWEHGHDCYSVSDNNFFFLTCQDTSCQRQNIDVITLNLKEKYFISHGIIKVSETRLVCHRPLMLICRNH